MNPTAATAPSLRSLVLVPAAITLLVTLIRLGLEFAGSPAWLANHGAGGAGAVIGIVWLPLLFGPWFAMRLRPHVASTKALWKPLVKTLWVYGLLARLPVFLLTIPAVLGNWGTHYDQFGADLAVGTKLAIGFGAQMVFWASIWTVVTGLLAAAVFVAVRPQPKPATA